MIMSERGERGHFDMLVAWQSEDLSALYCHRLTLCTVVNLR